MKIKITKEGQACRHCGTPVILESHSEPFRKNVRYWYRSWFRCPNKKCRSIYIIHSERVELTSSVKRKKQTKPRAGVKKTVFSIPHIVTKQWYSEIYLTSKHWKRIRAEALERANYHCQLNAQHTKNLNVHHNNYKRLGRELPGDVVVLCKDCHEKHHTQIKTIDTISAHWNSL